MSADGFEEDAVGDPIIITTTTPGTKFMKRREAIKESKIYHFSIKPLFDLATTPNVLVPGLELRISFEKNLADIPLMHTNGNKKFKIKFIEASLSCRRHTLTDPTSTFMQSINTRRLNYPINRCSTRVRQLNSGSLIHRVSNISDGQVPYHILCALITDAQLTNINNNPCILGTHNLKSFQLTKNSKGYPKRELEVNEAGNRKRTYKYFLNQVR